MAMTRGRPGNPAVRKSKCVGPAYDEGRFDAPWNADIDGPFGDEEDKASCSETAVTFEGGGAPMVKGKYDALWNGK